MSQHAAPLSPAPPSAAAPAHAAASGTIRPFARGDLDAIAGLFADVFYHRPLAAPEALKAHIADIYLNHPWRDPETPSLVYLSDDGAVDGFVGVLPLRLNLGPRRLRGAVAGSLMVRDAAQRPMAGARLLRTFLKGPQDISLGDTTNAVSEALWTRIGGVSLPLSSLEFTALVRPARFAATVAATRAPWLGPVMKAAGSAIDALRRRAPAGDTQDTMTDDAGWLTAVAALTRPNALGLELADGGAAWLLKQAALKRKHGTLHRRVVRGKNGRPIGAYLIYGRRGEPAELLQAVLETRDADAVFAGMMHFARTMGFSAMRGRTQPALMPALFRAGCLMRHRSYTVVDAHEPALLSALQHATLGGLFGETWTRITSDPFDRVREGVV